MSEALPPIVEAKPAVRITEVVDRMQVIVPALPPDDGTPAFTGSTRGYRGRERDDARAFEDAR